MAIVQALACILLEMEPLDADGNTVAVLEIDSHRSFANDRGLVLADLIALRQIGVEIVLPVENRFEIDLCLEPEPGEDCLPHAFLIDYRQHAGHRGINQRNMAVGRSAELR